MNVTYSCDFDLVLIPPDQSRWNCLAGGNWSYSTPPQCLAGKFLVSLVKKKINDFSVICSHKNYL